MSWNMLNNGVCPPALPKPPGFVKVASSYDANMAIDSLGRLYTWGNCGNTYTGQTPVSVPASPNFTRHPATFRANPYYPSMVYPYQTGYPKSDWIDCQTFEYMLMAMDSEGYIYAVGEDGTGTSVFGRGGWGPTSQYKEITGHVFTPGDSQAITFQLVNSEKWSRFVLGGYHVIAQKADKSLWIWGKNLDNLTYGSASYIEDFMSLTPIQMTWVPGPVKLFDADYAVTVVVTESNQIYQWGSWGNFMYPTQTPTLIPFTVPSGATIIDVKCNFSGIIILLSNGDVYGIGWMVGFVAPSEEALVFTKAPGGHNFIKIWAAQETGAAALDDQGVLWAWGNQSFLIVQGGVDDITSYTVPMFTGGSNPSIYRWIDFAAGSWSHLAINNEGRLFSWGTDVYGMQGIGLFQDENEIKYSAIECGPFATLEDGTKPFASPALMQQIISAPLAVGAPSGASSRWTMLYNGDCPHEAPPGFRFIFIARSFTNQAALDNHGRLFTWQSTGSNGACTGQTPVAVPATNNYSMHPATYVSLGATEMLYPYQAGNRSDWLKVQSSENVYMMLGGDNKLYFLGTSYDGQGGMALGAGYDWDNTVAMWKPSGNSAIFPTLVNNDIWQDFALGYYHALGLKADGTVWIWGTNYDSTYGMPVYAEAYKSLVPIQITGLSAIKLLDANYSVNAVVTTEDQIYAWGDLENNLLTTPTHYPLSLPSGVHILDVKCSWTGFGVLLSNGEVWCAGRFIAFQSAPNYMATSLTRVPGGHYFTQLSVYADGAAALDDQGNIWGWGIGNYVICQGETAKNLQAYLPAHVPLITAASAPGENNWVTFNIGSDAHGAIDTDGRLWMWGINNHGALGQKLRQPELNNTGVPLQVIDPTLDTGELAYSVSVEGMLVG